MDMYGILEVRVSKNNFQKNKMVYDCDIQNLKIAMVQLQFEMSSLNLVHEQILSYWKCIWLQV